MSEPFIGQIICAGFNFAPVGYAMCDGATLPSNQNQALLSLLGKNFGGNGTTNFMLPDLRGRTMVGTGKSPISSTVYPLAQIGGAEGVALTSTQVTGHQHAVGASTAIGTVGPAGNIFSSVGPFSSGAQTYPLYAVPGPTVQLKNAVSAIGGGAAHPNMQPFLVLTFAIATTGVYPQRP